MSGRPAKIRADWHVKHHSRFGAWDNLARPRRRKGSFCGKRPQNWLFRSASRRNRCEPGSETRRWTRPTRMSTRFAVLFPKTRAHLLTPRGQAARHELNLAVSGPRGRQNLQPWGASFRTGMAIRCSFVTRSAVRMYIGLPTTQATRGGSIANIVVQEIAMPMTQHLGKWCAAQLRTRA